MLSKKFKAVPIDSDTRILSRKEYTFEGIDVLHEKWSWDGILGESIIIDSADVKHLSDNEIKALIKTFPFQIAETNMTYKKSDSGFIFINYNFIVT